MTLSDAGVARLIREEFVPCWESIRPVPKVDIDFGDGRKLQRTLAGNTLFSICLPDGLVVDALPGVYSPADFVSEAGRTLQLLKRVGVNTASRPHGAREIAAWHRGQAAAAVQSEVRRITLSKAFVESPLLRALGVGMPGTIRAQPAGVPRGRNPAPAPDPLSDPKAALAAVSAGIEDVSKRPSSVEQLRERTARLPAAEQPTPEQLGRRAVDLDSTTNVRLVRPAVHLLFTTYERLPEVRNCRDEVYDRILHVPVHDPYLGLAAALVPGTPGGSGEVKR